MTALVTVITATTGRPELANCIKSVANQTYPNVQHLVYSDGPDTWMKTADAIFKSNVKGDSLNVIYLPYSIGKDRYNGHRIYGSGTYVADGEYIIFLDDDNTLDPNHIEDCMGIMGTAHWTKSKAAWSYSLRKITTVAGEFLCNDDCESLGKWPSILDPRDYFIDVNCYCLPRMLAVQVSPIWHRKFREPGQPEVDRLLCHALRQIAPNFDCTGKYSVNYAVASNSQLSVKPEFFTNGNAEMLKRYNGVLPWHKA